MRREWQCGVHNAAQPRSPFSTTPLFAQKTTSSHIIPLDVTKVILKDQNRRNSLGPVQTKKSMSSRSWSENASALEMARQQITNMDGSESQIIKDGYYSALRPSPTLCAFCRKIFNNWHEVQEPEKHEVTQPHIRNL